MDDALIKIDQNSDKDINSIKLLLDNLPGADIEKLIYFLIYKLIDKKINEHNFIKMLNHIYINRARIDFTLLKNIRQIIDVLIDDNYAMASDFLIVLCDLKHTSNELTVFMNNILNSKGRLSVLVRNCMDINDMNDSITKIFNIICDADKYIKSFSKLSLNSHPASTNTILSGISDGITSSTATSTSTLTTTKSTKYSVKFIEEEFEHYYKFEILRRLILLREYFGLGFMKRLGIIAITIEMFNNISYDDAIQYYFNCVKKIRKFITSYIKLLRNYNRLLSHYGKIING